MTNSTTPNITLDSLLPSPYVFVYAIPLLVSSLLLAFAGAFLTLDRTCTFAPQAPTEFRPLGVQHNARRWWRLEGGVGGVAGGWVFGVHSSTFLSLIIMNRTSDGPLLPVYFLVIHIISSIIFASLSGRFKLAALACTGLAGGIGLALIVSVALHPSLLTRLIFVAILTTLVFIAPLLPIPRIQHPSLRLAASSAGAFGTVVAIALLARIPSWANVWERLWRPVSPENNWGTVTERGLSAAAGVILAGGILSDWFLRRQCGENPDRKWDAYLARYSADLPNNAERAGSFQPIRSFWDRLLYPHDQNPLIFPPDADLKSNRPSSDAIELRPTSPKLRRKRSAVKFKPLGGYSDSGSDNSDSEPEWDAKAPTSPPGKPWLKNEVSLGSTSYGSDDEGADVSKSGGKKRSSEAAVNYSDNEDIASSPLNGQKSKLSQKSHRDEPGWKPDFLKRHTSASPTTSSSVTAVSPTPPPGAVPMTPSLIRAIDRIGVAQKEVYGEASPQPSSSQPSSSQPPSSQPSSPHKESGAQWRGFWDRVQRQVGGT